MGALFALDFELAVKACERLDAEKERPMTDFVPTHEEIVPPPARVKVTVLASYEDAVGNVDITHDKRHDQPSYIGYVLAGIDKERTPIFVGDALIKYADGTFVVKPAGEVPAFYRPLPAPEETKALPKKSSAEKL